MKAGLEGLFAYLAIFAPFVFLFSFGRIGESLIYGGIIAGLSFLSCLWETIQLDIKQRKETKKKRGYGTKIRH